MLEKSQTYFFFGFLFIIGLISFFLVLPYLAPLALAAAFAVVFHGLHMRLTKLLGSSPKFAAWVTIIIVGLLIFTPLTFAGFQVVREARNVYLEISANGIGNMAAGDYVRSALGKISPSLASNTDQVLKQATSWVIGRAGGFFAGTLTVALDIFLGILALYYFLVDGSKIKKGVVLFSPLPDSYDEMIIDRLERTIGSVVRGTLVIALIQGTLAGIGFAMFGVPNPALWGTVTSISALIPGVGTSLVLIPAVIFLFLAGKTAAALGLAVWAAIAVGLIDNFLGPRLMQRGAGIHPFAILLSVLGGIGLFGPLGFLIGPLVASLLFTLIDIYGSLRTAKLETIKKNRRKRYA